ncbi:MAG TPA: hypothetical protein VN890_01665 [Methylocella sp.]|nr:hypothetical protein [Methylocella sp.]
MDESFRPGAGVLASARGFHRHDERGAVDVGDRAARHDPASVRIDLDAPASGRFQDRLHRLEIEVLGQRVFMHEGGAVFAKAWERIRICPDKRVGFDFFKTAVDETVFQCVRRVLEARRRGESIGPVQLLPLFPARRGQPQDAAKKLFDGRRRFLLGDRTQDIGEGAVPAFPQLRLGNDEPHRAIAREKVEPVDFVGLAGCDGNAFLRLPEALDKQLLHLFGMESLFRLRLSLRLKQHDRPDEFAGLRLFFRGDTGELVEPADGVANRIVGVGASAQHERQLDHLRRFQFGGRDLVQDIRRGHAFRRVRLVWRDRGCREFHDERRSKARQDIEGKVRAGVMGFVHNHHRPPQTKDVCERWHEMAARSFLQTLPKPVRQTGEMVHQLAIRRVDF